jgi:hypothetical protein
MANHDSCSKADAGAAGGSVQVAGFGALADGIADDSPAIQAALDSGVRHVLIPGGEYLLKNPLYPREGQTLEIHGTLRVADAVVSPLVRDLEIGGDIIQVQNGELFHVGQMVMVYDENLPVQGGGRKVRRQNAGCARVESISGQTIRLSLRSARRYEVRAGALLASVHSAIVVHASRVRLFGTGWIDGNKAGQFNACPGRLDRVDGVESIQGCGVAVAAFPERLTGVVIEGLRVVDTLLHGIRMKDCDHSVIRHNVCLRAHDKNITLERVRDCEVSHNFACDSEWEDGIQFHQKADPGLWSHRVRMIGNTCTGNARVGLGVGAGMQDFVLMGNLCAYNGANLALRGDRITSIGDTAIGGNDRLFPYSGPRPNVSLMGRFINVQNLTALGTPGVAVGLGGTDITLSGGHIGNLEWETKDGDGIALDFQPMKRASEVPLTDADRVVISGVRISGCRSILRAAAGTGRITLQNNIFSPTDPPWILASGSSGNFTLSGNEGWVTEARGLLEIGPGQSQVRIPHGLFRAPDLSAIHLTAASPGAAGVCVLSVDAEAIEILLPHPAGPAGERVLWSADASKVGLQVENCLPMGAGSS